MEIKPADARLGQIAAQVAGTAAEQQPAGPAAPSTTAPAGKTPAAQAPCSFERSQDDMQLFKGQEAPSFAGEASASGASGSGMSVGSLLSGMTTFGPAGLSESPTEVLDKAKALEARLLPSLKPGDKTWIDDQAKKLGLGQMDESALQPAIDLRFQDQEFKPDTAKFLVLTQAIAVTDKEITKGQVGPERNEGSVETVQDMKSLLSDLRADPNELSEEMSRRLQMAMDRHNKLAATLSNLMKKYDSSMNDLVANLK